MNIILPPPPDNYRPGSFAQAFDAIRRAILPAISKDEATPRVLLQAPNGKVYELTVDNTGTLTTALNDGKSHI